MKLTSMLLATAAGLTMATGAQAADLPGEAVPAAVDYVKVCDTFGSGFFYIPGGETCLKIDGRVRFRVTYNSNDAADDTIGLRADGRVRFDARTATEYGTLRSFFAITDTGVTPYDPGNNDPDNTKKNNFAGISDAFISIGYLTVGYAGSILTTDRLYGIDSFSFGGIDDTTLQVTLMADDLGGGFYAGASIISQEPVVTRKTVTGINGEIGFEAKAGIAGQPWGSFDVSAFYYPEYNSVTFDDSFGVKATAVVSVTDDLEATLTAGYVDVGPVDYIGLGIAATYAVTTGTDIYAGVMYNIFDATGLDDEWAVQAGVKYAVTAGLSLQGEVTYSDTNDDGENLRGIMMLTRSW